MSITPTVSPEAIRAALDNFAQGRQLLNVEVTRDSMSDAVVPPAQVTLSFSGSMGSDQSCAVHSIAPFYPIPDLEIHTTDASGWAFPQSCRTSASTFESAFENEEEKENNMYTSFKRDFDYVDSAIAQGFKAFHHGLICKGKQYSENATFFEDGGNMCGRGMMHFSEKPFDIFKYYDLFAENPTTGLPEIVDIAGVAAPKNKRVISDDNTKSASPELHIFEKFSLDEFLSAAKYNYGKFKEELNSCKMVSGSFKLCYDDNETYNGSIFKRMIGIGANQIITALKDAVTFSKGSTIVHRGNRNSVVTLGDMSVTSCEGYENLVVSNGDGSTGFVEGNDNVIVGTGRYNGYAKGNSNTVFLPGKQARYHTHGKHSMVIATGQASFIDSDGSDSMLGSSKNVLIGLGEGDAVRGRFGDLIILGKYDFEHNLIGTVTRKIDNDRIKEGTWYCLNKAGSIVQVTDKEDYVNKIRH